MPKVLQIKAEPLTADAFHPFGQVIAMDIVQMKIVNDRFRDEPDLYYARFTCDAPSNYGKYCNPEFDKLFEEQSRVFDVEKRTESIRKMERLLLEDLPADRGYYWKSSMGYWNRVQNWPPLLGMTVYNYRKFEQSGAKTAGVCEL
jgi:ABC-type transport system substrate-binding protein